MSFGNVGKVWTPDSLREHLKGLSRPSWVEGITLHHCAEPSLAQRPTGLKAQHLENLKDFYQNDKGWSSGPHLFIDEDEAWGMCPFREKGVHAVSFNSSHIGIEILGDYDSEDPQSGRGLACWTTCFACVKVLLDWLGLPCNEDTVNFHRDDPRTNKTCPGTKVKKKWVIDAINGASVVTPEPIKWEVFVDGKSIGKFDEKSGKVIVPCRATLVDLGGDEAMLSWDSKTKRGIYKSEILDESFMVGSTLMTPIRELTNAVGSIITSVDVANRVANVSKTAVKPIT